MFRRVIAGVSTLAGGIEDAGAWKTYRPGDAVSPERHMGPADTQREARSRARKVHGQPRTQMHTTIETEPHDGHSTHMPDWPKGTSAQPHAALRFPRPATGESERCLRRLPRQLATSGPLRENSPQSFSNSAGVHTSLRLALLHTHEVTGSSPLGS